MRKSEGGFKPLFTPVSRINTESKETEKEKRGENLEEVISKIQQEKERLKEEIVRIKGEKEKLLEDLKKLKKQLEDERIERQKLIEELNSIKEEKENLASLCKELHLQLEEVFNEFKEKSAEFIVRVLEEFSFSLPQTEALKEDLEHIFSELTNYKIPVKLYMNPKDYRTLESYILSLKERLRREGLEIQVITDDKLGMGELQIKSEQFQIERSPKEFAKAIFEEVFRNVFKGH